MFYLWSRIEPMQLWLLLAGVLTFQEPISSTYVILEAIRAHYPIILIHLLWLVITSLQVYLGYIFGKWVQKRFAASKFESWVARWTKKMGRLVGKNGERVALIFITILTLPVFTGFIASWLPISFWTILFFSILGDLVWYVSVWIGVYGANEFASSLQTTVLVIVVISILFSIPMGIWQRRIIQKK